MHRQGEQEWVVVDYVDDAVPGHPSDGSSEHAGGSDDGAGSPPRRRVGAVVAAALALIAGLLLWPEGSSTGVDLPGSDGQLAGATAPAPDDPRLLPWPGRGPLAGDEALVDEAAQVWRAAAAAEDVGSAPGEAVHALWAGEVSGRTVVLLQSVGVDGLPRVAQVTEAGDATGNSAGEVTDDEMGDGAREAPGDDTRDGAGEGAPSKLLLTVAEPVLGEPDFLALSYPDGLGLGGVLDEPGTALLQVLPAPELLSAGVSLQKAERWRFADVEMGDDGISTPWVYAPWLTPGGPVVAAVRTQGADPGIVAVGSPESGSLVPASPRVQLVPAGWGRLRADTPEDYIDAVAAVRSLDRSSGRVSVLGSTPTSNGRAALLEVRPRGPGSPVVVTVATRGMTRTTSPARPADPGGDMVVGAARTPAGEVVVVGTGPPDTRRVVLGIDGSAVAAGARTTAMWLPAGSTVDDVSAQGYRGDESFVGRATLDVTDL